MNVAPSFPIARAPIAAGAKVHLRPATVERYPSLKKYARKQGTVTRVLFGQPATILVEFPPGTSFKLLTTDVWEVVPAPVKKERQRAAVRRPVAAVPSSGGGVAGDLARQIAAAVEEWRFEFPGRDVPLEHFHQKALIRQVRESAEGGDDWFFGIFAIPNGTFTNAVVAARMVAEGVEVGVPDLFAARVHGGYFGCFLEVKVPGGTVSPEQKGWLDLLHFAGYYVEVMWGAPAAWERLCWYRSLPPTVVVPSPPVLPPLPVS